MVTTSLTPLGCERCGWRPVALARPRSEAADRRRTPAPPTRSCVTPHRQWRYRSIFGRRVESTAVCDGAHRRYRYRWRLANSAIFGTVEGIKVDISDQATVTKGGVAINLWQRNMFAIRAEVEVGFIVRDAAHFVKLTEDASGS